MGHIQNLEDLISMLLRRRWWIALVVLVGVTLSAAYAKSRPDVYEATSVIQVEVPVVSDPDAPVSGSAQVLQAIEQRLTARENMLTMIERHGLFADLAGLPDDKKVFLLRQSISFQSVASANGQGFGTPASVSAIIITARLDDAEKAARVANDFAQGIVDQGSSGQIAKARETVSFFLEEEARVWQTIVALEAEIADYKNANRAALPGVRDTQRDELVSLEVDLRELDQTIVGLEDERRQVEQSGTQRATDRRQIEDLNARIAVATAQKAALIAQKAQLEATQTATPEVERALSGYDRRLQQLQDQYQSTNVRLAEAQTSQLLAERQQTERFSMLERALTPPYSSGSGGKKIAVLGAVGSVALAVALAFLLDLLNPVVRTSAQMERELDLRPVVTIPEVSRRQFRQRSAVLRYGAIVGGALLLIMAATAAIS